MRRSNFDFFSTRLVKNTVKSITIIHILKLVCSFSGKYLSLTKAYFVTKKSAQTLQAFPGRKKVETGEATLEILDCIQRLSKITWAQQNNLLEKKREGRVG